MDFEPRLSARRESAEEAARIDGLQGSRSARAVARHFRSTRKTAGIRPAKPVFLQQRKVVVVARKLLSRRSAGQALSHHLGYLTRAGVEQDGGAARFFDSESDNVDPRAFIARCREHPGHYRLMVNPEDGCELGDLRAYGRKYVQAVERNVGSTIEWIGTAHHDTGRPHLHLVLLERSAEGRNLGLTGDHLNSGLRQTAETVATELLGPRIARTASRTIQANRLTDLDLLLISASPNGRVESLAIPAPHRPDALRRLIYLERKGWARAAGPTAWEIPPGLPRILRQAAQHEAREVAAARIVRKSDWHVDYPRLQAVSLKPGEQLGGAFVGVRPTGPLPRGAQAVVIDGLDGRLAHVLVRDTNAAICLDQIPTGAVIEAAGSARGVRPSDQTIAEVAAERGGVWSVADHAEARPKDWPKFIGFHHRRVEAMSLEGACIPLGDGRYSIPGDYCQRASQIDSAQWGPSEISVRILDHRRLEDQITSLGLTWLDRLMTTADRPDLSGPFGEAVTGALAERSRRLRMSGLGAGNPLLLSEADILRLRAIEVRSVFEPLEGSGKPVFLTTERQRAAGVYVKRVHVAGAPYAVLEGKSAYHLVQWTPGMEACRGRTLNAMVENTTVSFRTVRSLGAEAGL